MKAKLATTLAVAISMLAAPALGQDMDDTNEKTSLRFTRSCTPDPGLPVTLTTTTGASASTAALDINSTYIVRCTTETYLATGTTAPTATSSNFPFPPAVWPLRTNGTVKYVAGLAKTLDGACYFWKCK